MRQAVLALKDINPAVVMPLHCTGERFLDIMAQEMPGTRVRSSPAAAPSSAPEVRSVGAQARKSGAHVASARGAA